MLLLAGWAGASAQGDTPQTPVPPEAQGPDVVMQEAGLPFLRNFSPKEYGAEGQNWAIVQDPSGVIYVGNNDGVLVFDGLRWQLIRTASKTIVRSLAVDAAGRVYVGAVGEIGYLEPDAAGRTRYVSLLPRLPAETRDFADVWQTFATPEGIYFSSYQRLFRLQGTEVRVWNPETSFHFSFRVRNRLFIREQDRGLMELVDGDLRLVPGGDRFARERIYAMLPWGGARSDGNLSDTILIGTRTQGLFVFEGTSFRPLPTEADAGLKRDLLFPAARMADGNLALGTQGGVYFIDPKGRLLGRLDKAGGLQDAAVYALFPDRQGGLWLGLDRGIARVDAGSPLTRFDERTGLAARVISVHRHRGRLYVGTGKGLFRLEPGPEPRFRPIPGILSQTWGFLSVGEALLVANYEGVYQVRGDAAVRVGSPGTAFALHASRTTPGRVFVGLQEGLGSLRNVNGRWLDEGRIPGVSDEVRMLLEMPDGRLWVGTQATGVLRLSFPRDGQGGAASLPQVERFGSGNGLPSMNENRVDAIGGQALFATHQGVYHFDEGRRQFEADPRFGRLFPEGPRWVSALREDPQGRIWMSSSDEARGLKEAGAALPQPDGTYRWDPNPLRAFSGAATDSIYADHDGVLWFGGGEGLFRYDGRVTKDYGQGFTALLRQVSHIGGGEVLFGGAGKPGTTLLAYADNAVRFEYAAPSFEGAEPTRFQVFLEGYDPDWSPWTAEGFREYTNLREGAYRFRVRARNLYGTLSEEGLYVFRVLPPWYRTVWAYLGYLLAAGGLGWSIVRWRLQRLEAEKRALEATVAARTGELRAKNDQLETLNAIVKSINGRLDFDELLEAILRECRVIHGVEKALALVRLPDTTIFTFRAALGWTRAELEGIQLDLTEAEARYTVDAEEVSEDIFLIREPGGRAAEAKLRQLVIPKALLVVRIRIERQPAAGVRLGGGEVEGYLIFENQQDDEAFDEHDLDLLRGLKEHFVSAFQKARARATTEEARARAEEREHEAEAQRRVAEAERARAEEANRAKSVFLANMSHELRTPLNGVLGFAQLMDRAPQRSTQDRQHLATIRRSGEHLLGLINDVLSIAKIEAGSITLAEAPFDLRSLLRDLDDMLRVRAEGRDLWFRTEVSSDLPGAVMGDEGRLRQVLLNLLGNAIKFTQSGGITLRAHWSNGRAVFEVEDTGPGIAREELGELFAPFAQTSTGRQSKEGTGLGLALSRQLARSMGGDVTLQSTPGRGTTFRVEVALSVTTDDTASTSPSEQRRVRALAPGQPACRVLVVDDLLDNRMLLSGLLASVGFDVKVAAGGEEAIALWREWQPQLIWMDKRMPGINGLETTRRIREEERRQGGSRVAILALSASALEHEQSEILASGCDDFVPKPFQEGTIFAKMAERLGVSFVYDEPAQAQADARASTAGPVVTTKRLAIMPAAWVAELRRAITAGQTKKAIGLADEVEPRDAALADALRAMIRRYDFDALDALLAAAGSARPSA